MIKPLNPISLKVFVDVVTLGSFTAAARRNDLSQPAVSFHMRQLEERFGVPLLERSGRKAIPTVAGVELLNHATRVTQALAATDAAMARFAGNAGGTLRIGTGTTFCMAVLPRVIRHLRDTLPGLRLAVTTGTTPEIIRGLTNDDLDVGIVTTPVGEQTLTVTPVLEDEVLLLAPTTLEVPTPLTPAAMLDLAPMVFEPEGMTRTLIDGWFREAGHQFHPTVSLGSVEAIRDLVEMGIGPALLSRLALGAGSATHPGTTIHALTPPLRRTLAVATHRDRPSGSALEAFLSAVHQASRS